MQTSYTGQFQIVDWQEQVKFENHQEHKVTYADIKQQYLGELAGVSEVQYLMCYTDKGHAWFTGFEVFTCSDEKGSTLTLRHEGEFKAGIASSKFIVVEGTGTGQFKGAHGTGSFQSGDAGKANFHVDLSF